MLKQLKITNFTAFAKATFDFSPGLNAIVGANGTGKTHVLKLGYLFARAWPELERSGVELTKSGAEAYFEKRLMGLFRPDRLAHLLRSGVSGKSEIGAELEDSAWPVEDIGNAQQRTASWWFTFLRKGQESARIQAVQLPDNSVLDVWDWSREPILIPSKEVVSLFEGLIGLFERYEIQLDESYRDLAVAMSIPERRTPSGLLPDLLSKLSHAIGGELELEKGKLVLRQSAGGQLEPHLIAEGFRKLGMLLYLVRNEVIAPGRTLFWDEPEANLNPELIRPLIEVVVALAEKGIQVILATHSLFVLREIEILLREPDYQKVPRRFFALAPSKRGVKVSRGESFETVDPILSLEADLAQSGRFVEVMD